MKDDWKKQVWEKEQMKSSKAGGENMSEVDWDKPKPPQFDNLNVLKSPKGFEMRPEDIKDEPDWKTAPLAAQFYSAGLFRMYREGVEFYWYDGKWVQNSERPKTLEWYVEKSDFEDRPKLSSVEWGNGYLPPVGSYFEFSYNGKSWEERIMLFNDGISCLMSSKKCPDNRWHYKSSDPYMEFRPICKAEKSLKLSVEERIQRLEESHATFIKRFEEILSSIPTNKP